MIKNKDDKLIKNIFILLFSGILLHFLSLFEKITYTRISGIELVKLYNLILPTIIFFISISSFGLPISISKITSEKKYKDNEIIKNALIIGLIINIILIIIILISSKYIAISIHNKMLEGPIKIISIIIPFTMISSVQRGLLHGKEEMFIPSISNIIEIIMKIILILIFFRTIINHSKINAIYFLILLNLITEIISIIIMNFKIKKYRSNIFNLNINKKIIEDILKISLPVTLIRIISSIGMFLEPIILTNLLIKYGFNLEYINTQYAIINSYIIPILNFPIIISSSISVALLPNITKLYSNKKYKETNIKIIYSLLIILTTGMIFIIIFLLIPNKILFTLYKINFGINYIYLLAPCFIFLYIEPLLSVIIQASGHTNKILYVAIFSLVFKYLTFYLLAKLKFGINAFCISIMVDMFISSFFMIIIISKTKRD